MTIRDAKEQIKHALTAYFTKDALGYYKIPMHKQRPICMIGPPGVGKTAVMAQIAGELGVGLVSYSMTHHTRQSALGLPFITQKTYGGTEYQVSEYTMSEIIASVYNLMAETGVAEGILFLDEINCVSETLTPCMLQFLQYKVFGQHSLPEGWLVVTAGNPPEYNKSVRDFDIVTWDRLKRMDVEPDYETWKAYAAAVKAHPAVTTYLAAKTKDFYRVETTAEGKSFVTARGWDDLSQMLALYEQCGIAADMNLIGQYVQHDRVAKDFAVYYDLFTKYRGDYQIETILDGAPPEAIVFRAQRAAFDERLSLLGLLIDALGAHIGEVVETEDALAALRAELAIIRDGAAIDGRIQAMRELLAAGARSMALPQAKQRQTRQALRWLEDDRAAAAKTGVDGFAPLKAAFEARVTGLRQTAAEAGRRMENVFAFAEQAFGEGEEMLLLVTELTAAPDSGAFIGRYGSEGYARHNKALQFYERHSELDRRLAELDI